MSFRTGDSPPTPSSPVLPQPLLSALLCPALCPRGLTPRTAPPGSLAIWMNKEGHRLEIGGWEEEVSVSVPCPFSGRGFILFLGPQLPRFVGAKQWQLLHCSHPFSFPPKAGNGSPLLPAFGGLQFSWPFPYLAKDFFIKVPSFEPFGGFCFLQGPSLTCRGFWQGSQLEQRSEPGVSV